MVKVVSTRGNQKAKSVGMGRDFPLTSINVDIERRDDGNVPLAPLMYDILPAKVSWGLVTP